MPAPLSLHVDRTALLGRTLLGALCLFAGLATVSGPLIGARTYRCFCERGPESQRIVVRQIAGEGFLVWARKNERRRCPETLMEVAEEVDRKDIKDAWGRELIWYCGDSMPPHAKGDFAVLSVGADGLLGTPDDIVSWE